MVHRILYLPGYQQRGRRNLVPFSACDSSRDQEAGHIIKEEIAFQNNEAKLTRKVVEAVFHWPSVKEIFQCV